MKNVKIIVNATIIQIVTVKLENVAVRTGSLERVVIKNVQKDISEPLANSHVNAKGANVITKMGIVCLI